MEKRINGVLCKQVADEWAVYFDMAMTMLEEIIANLCDNGIKYNKQGGHEIVTALSLLMYIRRHIVLQPLIHHTELS